MPPPTSTGPRPPPADLPATHQVLEVNLFGAWRLTNALLPLLRRSDHPRIVNVSSGAGSHRDDQFGLAKRGGTAASYGISKAALNALTSTLAAELADTPILVNAVCPGLTATWPGAEAMGARPVAEGAASVLWAATLPDDGPTGELRRDGRPRPGKDIGPAREAHIGLWRGNRGDGYGATDDDEAVPESCLLSLVQLNGLRHRDAF